MSIANVALTAPLQYSCVQNWEPYNATLAKKIDDAFNNKEDKVDIDAERFIHFGKMKQIRFDNEKRVRNVRRATSSTVVAKNDDGGDAIDKKNPNTPKKTTPKKKEDSDDEGGDKGGSESDSESDADKTEEDSDEDAKPKKRIPKVAKWYWANDDEEWIAYALDKSKAIEEA